MHIYLDIETIPGQAPGLKDEIARGITPWWAFYDGAFVRHVAAEQPFVVKVDGRTGRGLILAPERS